jgi:hypothetical protein
MDPIPDLPRSPCLLIVGTRETHTYNMILKMSFWILVVVFWGDILRYSIVVCAEISLVSPYQTIGIIGTEIRVLVWSCTYSLVIRTLFLRSLMTCCSCVNTHNHAKHFSRLKMRICFFFFWHAEHTCGPKCNSHTTAWANILLPAFSSAGRGPRPKPRGELFGNRAGRGPMKRIGVSW